VLTPRRPQRSIAAAQHRGRGGAGSHHRGHADRHMGTWGPAARPQAVCTGCSGRARGGRGGGERAGAPRRARARRRRRRRL
jgi:hypothetical protein